MSSSLKGPVRPSEAEAWMAAEVARKIAVRLLGLSSASAVGEYIKKTR
jgi:hypothetical protein